MHAAHANSFSTARAETGFETRIDLVQALVGLALLAGLCVALWLPVTRHGVPWLGLGTVTGGIILLLRARFGLAAARGVILVDAPRRRRFPESGDAVTAAASGQNAVIERVARRIAPNRGLPARPARVRVPHARRTGGLRSKPKRRPVCAGSTKGHVLQR